MKEKYSTGMSDTYQSRILAIARQNKNRNIKFIKNINNDQIEVEFSDGSASWLPWEEVLSERQYNPKKEI
ncbi:hypothetical protein EBR43_04645 [bacterium]|nr:hypothetical protein [bacterium]